MSPKNKKKVSKKRNNWKRWKSNGTDAIVEVEEEQVSVPTQQEETDTNIEHEIKERGTKKNCLSIIEQTADRLKVDGAKFATLLERLITISDGKSQNRAAGMELISCLLSNVKEYKTKEIGSLKVKLNSVFYPKELKQLIVDPGNLIECISMVGFLFGHYSPVAFLEKNGCRIKVEMKKAVLGEYDDLSVIQEAKLLSQLRHENIVKILAFDTKGPRFALEFMKLGDLSAALQKYEFTAKKRLELVKAVTSAMIYITEKGYVLRNLESENIFLDSEANCKIGNFHYCRYVKDTNGIYIDKDATENNLSAPEVRKKKQFSTKSDVWDMALLACEIFCVHPKLMSSFHVPPIFAIIALIFEFLSEELFSISYKCPNLLWTYLRTNLINKDPNKRPTFSEIMEELQKYDD